MSTQELVQIILTQQEIISHLKQEIERLKLSRALDSKTSSKPPSSDLLKKSEKKKQENQPPTAKNKRKPGGQPGHEGKTRKGFERVDRYELLKVDQCLHCGQQFESVKAEKIETQQVAQLVERPIEIVEYQRHHIRCNCCGKITSPNWSKQMIPGQDLGIKLQGLLGWLGNYGHLTYEKQQELLWELGRINVGVGTLVTTNRRISVGIRPSVMDLEEWINQNHPPLHIDETPWPVKGIKEWLWVFPFPQFLSVSRCRQSL